MAEDQSAVRLQEDRSGVWRQVAECEKLTTKDWRKMKYEQSKGQITFYTQARKKIHHLRKQKCFVEAAASGRRS